MARGQKRAQMIDGAVSLLATRGLEGTSLRDVLAATGAARGSTYHHFPGGKDELIVAAIDLAARRAFDAMAAGPTDSPAAVMRHFVGLWRTLLTSTDLRAGCAVVAVTVSTDSDEVRARAGAIFAEWRGRLAARLVASGVAADEAESLAALALSATEGAVALARAEGDLAAFDLVARRLELIASSD